MGTVITLLILFGLFIYRNSAKLKELTNDKEIKKFPTPVLMPELINIPKSENKTPNKTLFPSENTKKKPEFQSSLDFVAKVEGTSDIEDKIFEYNEITDEKTHYASQSSLENISRMSDVRRGVIWSEILNRKY